VSTFISKRKIDHLRIALSEEAQTGNPGFTKYRFVHNALPEVDFDKIDTSTLFLGKKVIYPFFVSCMTGGVEKGRLINRNLAIAAEKKGIAMGVGSQRAAIENPKLRKLFVVRNYAPSVPVMANVGLVQLNYGYGLSEFQEIVNMVDADALAVLINPVQEAIQPEGDRNFEKLLPKLEKIIPKLSVPIVVKEVGFGLSYEVVKRLYEIGIRHFDTAGWGGTSWAVVEGKRRKDYEKLGELFSEWGIPTTESIKMCQKFKSKIKFKKKKDNIYIYGSGGIRTGVDIAKCLVLGADLAGIAAPFARSALISAQEVEKLIDKLALELKITMFGVGAINIEALKRVKLQPVS